MLDMTALRARLTAGQCLGCPNCSGPCQAVLELLTVPSIVLKRR